MSIEIDTEWMDKARCKGVNPNIFFPTQEEEQLKVASECWLCPVRAECLGYALENKIDDGVWGGETESGRRRIKRQLRKSDQSELNASHEV